MKKILLSLLVITSVISAKSLDEQLFDSCRDGDVAKVESLIEQGADVKTWEGSKALCWAVIAENIEIVRLLVESGAADVNSQEEYGRTPLMLTDRVLIVEKLIELGADLNIQNNYGGTALFFCASSKLKCLIDAGADIHIKDNDGRTALMYSGGESTKLLIDAGADIHMKDNDGRTALTLIALKGIWCINSPYINYAYDCLDGIRYLIEAGADVTEEDSAMIDIITYELQKHERGEG